MIFFVSVETSAPLSNDWNSISSPPELKFLNPTLTLTVFPVKASSLKSSVLVIPLAKSCVLKLIPSL